MPNRPTIEERLAAIDALRDQPDSEATRALLRKANASRWLFRMGDTDGI